MHFGRTARLLCSQKRRVSNPIFHISAQLFDYENLAQRLVDEHHLHRVILSSLNSMLKTCFIQSHMHTEQGNQHYCRNLNNNTLYRATARILEYTIVVLITHPTLIFEFLQYSVHSGHALLRNHSYSVLVNGLLDLLHHRDIVLKFLRDSRALELWASILLGLQGMNLTTRQLDQHITYELDGDYAAFAAENELFAMPMWYIMATLKHHVCRRKNEITLKAIPRTLKMHNREHPPV